MKTARSRLSLTPQALRDLDEIWDYIATDNPDAADRTLDQLHDVFDLIDEQPRIGVRQPLLADGAYRRFVHGRFVIYYRPSEAGVVLLRVLHGARKHDDLL